jgi:hypothetical protein
LRRSGLVRRRGSARRWRRRRRRARWARALAAATAAALAAALAAMTIVGRWSRSRRRLRPPARGHRRRGGWALCGKRTSLIVEQHGDVPGRETRRTTSAWWVFEATGAQGDDEGVASTKDTVRLDARALVDDAGVIEHQGRPRCPEYEADPGRTILRKGTGLVRFLASRWGCAQRSRARSCAARVPRVSAGRPRRRRRFPRARRSCDRGAGQRRGGLGGGASLRRAQAASRAARTSARRA